MPNLGFYEIECDSHYLVQIHVLPKQYCGVNSCGMNFKNKRLDLCIKSNVLTYKLVVVHLNYSFIVTNSHQCACIFSKLYDLKMTHMSYYIRL